MGKMKEQVFPGKRGKIGGKLEFLCYVKRKRLTKVEVSENCMNGDASLYRVFHGPIGLRAPE